MDESLHHFTRHLFDGLKHYQQIKWHQFDNKVDMLVHSIVHIPVEIFIFLGQYS